MTRFVVTSGTAGEPVTIAEVKEHLRIVGEDEDEYLRALSIAATDVVQEITGRQLMSAGFDAHLDCFPAGPIQLIEPLYEVTEITYYDHWEMQQSMVPNVDFLVNTVAGTVSPLQGQSWPAGKDVVVSFKSGYTISAVPAGLKAAILLLIGDLYENREATFIGPRVTANPTVDRLIGPYRTFR